MKKILLLVFGALVALPCAQIIGQEIDIPKAGKYRYVDSIPIPPIPIPEDTFVIVDNAVKGTQGYQFNYSSGWTDGTNDAWYARTLTYTGTTNGSVTFKFNGTKIEYYGEKGPTHGKVAVSINGGTEKIIDLYQAAFKQQVKLFTKDSLTQEVHTFKLRCTGTKNASSTGVYALIDYLKVFNQGFVPDITPPEPPNPEPPDVDKVVPIGQSIKAAVESSTSGTTVGLLEGNYTENLFNVPQGVSLVGAGKDKTFINFTGSMPQQSETAMIQLKGGTATMSVGQKTFGIIGIILLILLWLVANYGPWVVKIKRIVTGIIVVVIIGMIIYIVRPQATIRATGNQTISGFTINGKYLCNGGVIVDGRDNVKILDVRVQETTYFGAWLKNTTGSEFANNELINSSWASVGWVTGELDVFNITNTIIHHNFIKTTRTDKGYGIKALWPDGTVKNSKFYNNRFQLVHTSMWNNGSAPNIDIELHDTYYNGIEFYENDFSVMGLSLAGHKPSTGGRTIVRNNRFTWSSTAAIEVVCNNITIEANTFAGSPMMTANFAANGKYTDIIVNNNDFNSSGTNPGWGALHLIGPDGMDMTITNNRYNNTKGYQLVKHMGAPSNSTIVQSGNVIK